MTTQEPTPEKAPMDHSPEPTKQKELPKQEHTAPPAANADWTAHFEHLAKELSKLPEYLVNALREAVPEKEKHPQENQDAVVKNDVEKEAAHEPGKKHEKGKSQNKHKVGWGSRWMGAGQ